jgi:hypothetical protein
MAVTANRPFVVSLMTKSLIEKRGKQLAYPTKQLKYNQFPTVLLGYTLKTLRELAPDEEKPRSGAVFSIS